MHSGILGCSNDNTGWLVWCICYSGTVRQIWHHEHVWRLWVSKKSFWLMQKNKKKNARNKSEHAASYVPSYINIYASDKIPLYILMGHKYEWANSLYWMNVCQHWGWGIKRREEGMPRENTGITEQSSSHFCLISSPVTPSSSGHCDIQRTRLSNSYQPLLHTHTQCMIPTQVPAEGAVGRYAMTKTVLGDSFDASPFQCRCIL